MRVHNYFGSRHIHGKNGWFRSNAEIIHITQEEHDHNEKLAESGLPLESEYKSKFLDLKVIRGIATANGGELHNLHTDEGRKLTKEDVDRYFRFVNKGTLKLENSITGDF